jgi:DNA-binding transcriptional LysR family regulator
MPDRLKSMRVFVEVSEQGSFTSVATARGISPQIVAKHIEALEIRVGVRLLYRTTRRQGLTEHGRLYRNRCKAVLADIDDAEMQVSDAGVTLRGSH